MPDFDCNYDDLAELDSIIDGETYLQQSDLGVINRVAKLDEDGDVIDAFGVKITGTGDAISVGNRLDNEIINRQQADNAVRVALEQELAAQITSTLNTARADLAIAVSTLNTADLAERGQRIAAVDALNTSLSSYQTTVNAQLATLVSTTASHAATLLNKADLVSGKVPSSQLPSISLTTAISVANEAEMLALTTTQVQPGDLAVRPDGSWILVQNPPSVLNNWLRTSTGGEVLSVNGQTGVVVLSAADVGARSSSVNVPASAVTGLEGFQSSTASTLSSLGVRVTAFEDDETIVRLNEDGEIETSLLSDDLAYLNGSNQLVTKDGDPIIVAGSGNVDSVNGQTGIVVLNAVSVNARPASTPIPASDITGLEAVLEDVVVEGDSRLTDARTPTTHAASHAAAGSDPVTPLSIGARPSSVPLAISEVTSLQTTLTNHGNRINALEVGGGGGGGGGPGADVKAVRYDHFEVTGDFTDIQIDSPFGYNPSHPDADPSGIYYDPAGAADGEGVYAYLTPNGHLAFIRRNEAAPPDPALATQAALSALTTTVNGKASITALDALTTTVNGKALQSDLTALTSTVAFKANQSALDTTNTNVGLKANQTSLDATNAAVALKANQTALDATNTAVGLKASQADLTTATGRITVIEAAIPNKADLSGGKVLLSQIPTNIPTSSVSGLPAVLDAKADLIGGKLATSQLPALATQETYPVANRAEMLALTTAQVQVGDSAIILATVDKGQYTYVGTDPSVFSNWLKHSYPDDVVSSVNGQQGIVVLTASDVGARSSVVAVPMSDVNGLTSALALKSNVTDLAGKTSPADVNSLISASTLNKQLVARVATANVASLSGTQSIDGSLTALGSIVLLTAQISSIQNGLWVVNTGAWTRATDMSDGTYFVRGTLVLCSGGTANANTFWQETAASGVVGTNANNWVLAMRAGPGAVYTQSNGINIVSNAISVKTVTGGGVIVSSDGVALDPNVGVRKYAVNVPAGSNPVSITHNLNTLDVQVTVRDIASGIIVLAVVTVTGVNTISIEFASTPSSGQYRVVVQA